MKERAILPLVLTMSLPMVLSMLVSSLYNIVDSYFVAQISEDAMTAPPPPRNRGPGPAAGRSAAGRSWRR